MSWEERLRDAAFTSPSNTRTVFDYEDVSRSTPLRRTAFDVNGSNNSYVQPNGIGSRQYPMICYFSGPDCDTAATAFEAALTEDGTGLLEHPLYGTFEVIAYGSIERRDDLKSAANQAIVEVTFWTTTGAVYPTTDADPQNEIAAALEEHRGAQSIGFMSTVDMSSVAAQGRAAGTTRSIVDKSKAALGSAAATTTSVRQAFADAQQTITQGISILTDDPTALALEVSNMVSIPATAEAAIEERLDAYASLLTSVFASREGQPANELGGPSQPRHTVAVANDFHLAELTASSAVAASVACVLVTEFTTRPQAIAAAEALIERFNSLVAWRDDGYAALVAAGALPSMSTDLGGAYQALQSAVARAAGYLISVSFSLLPERARTLDRDRTIIDLCAELYGEVDGKLDFLIDTNSLTGSEILELPRGRRVVYYA